MRTTMIDTILRASELRTRKIIQYYFKICRKLLSLGAAIKGQNPN